jgi:hypothetical protein
MSFVTVLEEVGVRIACSFEDRIQSIDHVVGQFHC